MWCYILLLFIFGQIILQTKAVNMCTNGTSASTVSTGVTLNLINGTGVNGCYCNLKLENTNALNSVKLKIYFEVKHFSGCKYNLVIQYKNTSPRYSCSNNNTIYHDINKTDEIQLYLESTSAQDDTTFEVKITSNDTDVLGPKIRLECFSPDTTIKTSDKPPTTTMTSTQQTSTMETTNTITTMVMSTTLGSSTSSVFVTNSTLRPSPTSISESTKASTSGSQSGPTTVSTPRSSPGSTSGSVSESTTDIGLIGGVVGGILILVIVIIVVIVCIVRHRKKNNDKRDYCRPTETRSEHGYTDINLQARSNNSSPGSVMIDNVPNDSADPALPQQPNNSEKTGNGPVEMEIIENDLYVSSSDIDDFKSRDGNITNHNPEISNDQSKMEIIENDLYVSSDDIDDYRSRDGNITNHNPEISNDQSEMEIIKNDLYVSSDDLDDHKSRDGNTTNHNPEISNDQSEMEIIENDLYVSSDDVLNSTSNEDNAPVYAVVSKKSKRPPSDVNDNSKDVVQNDLVISL